MTRCRSFAGCCSFIQTKTKITF